MTIADFTNKNSSIEHADACPALFEMTMIGFTGRVYNTELPSYKIGISHIKDNELDYVSLISDQQEIGLTVVNEYLKNKAIISDLYEAWQGNFIKMMEHYYGFFKSDLGQLTDQELMVKSEELHDLYSRQISMPGFIDGFMFYAETRFNDLIKEFCKKNNLDNPVEIVSILTAPTSESFLSEEENDLMAIAELISATGKLNIKPEEILADEKLHQPIINHLAKYSWIKSSYAGYREYTIENVCEEIERIIKENKHENNLFTENKKKKEELIKQYSLDAETIAITELSDILIKWQDQRKQYTLTFVALKDKVLREICKRTGIAHDLIIYSLNSELKDIFAGNFDLNILKNRKEGVLFVYQNGLLIETITGGAVGEFMKKINSKVADDIMEIRGNVASMGKVQGIVKVVTSMKYLDKLEVGDILVAPMTRPEYLLGMRKAAAVVTDDGGITCHAAIVSRELKIPCVIGTKIATQVLHDGDLVEVDADKGIVRILKKQEEANIVKGVTASKGKVIGKIVGRVGVISSPEEFSKMEEGKIIVTSMTRSDIMRPEFVPIIKMAGALITNEGGVTCHAAIISRELGIPCIVGTVNATQVLHDGDLVEVDIEQGVVRIINQA